MNSPKAWGMRANPHGVNRMGEFLRDEIVALGWPGVGSLKGKDIDDLKAVLRRAYKIRDARELGRSAGLLDTFINRVSIRDYVVVPSPEDGSVFVGGFRSEYRYVKSKEKDNFPHQRSVTWLLEKSRIPRHQLPDVVISALRAQQPIFSIDWKAMDRFVHSRTSSGSVEPAYAEDIDTDAHAIEGRRESRMTVQARRDRNLREQKIRQAQLLGGGRLICEVPGCGFDFEAVYGKLGKGFAHVHHRKQLKTGERDSTPRDLAIVCANCHAMIHRRGGCRELDDLIRRERPRPRDSMTNERSGLPQSPEL